MTHVPSPTTTTLRRNAAGALLADLCIVGAGPGGLAAAQEAARFGARVVLVEAEAFGGNSLHAGCVPSRAMIAAAHATGAATNPIGPANMVAPAMASVASSVSRDRLAALGVHIVDGSARFLDRQTIIAGAETIAAKRFIVASGATPVIPAIPGLETVGYLTPATLFSLADMPKHLIILGGGPTGIEMAQAFRRLGAGVTVLEARTILQQEETDAVAIVREQMRADGITVHEGIIAKAAWRDEEGCALEIAQGAGSITVSGSHLLIAAGRRPNVDELGLEAADIALTDGAIVVDRYQRTSNRDIYLVGDASGGPQYASLAAEQGQAAARHALFGRATMPAAALVPRLTASVPAIATIGFNEQEARSRYGDILVLHTALAEIAAARIEGATSGYVKLIAARNGILHGATIVGPHSGELIATIAMAMRAGLKVHALADLVVPYPSDAAAIRQAASAFFPPGPTAMQRLARWVRPLLP